MYIWALSIAVDDGNHENMVAKAAGGIYIVSYGRTTKKWLDPFGLSPFSPTFTRTRLEI